jgi:4-hydroxybenzoate polyprenyltransferase
MTVGYLLASGMRVTLDDVAVYLCAAVIWVVFGNGGGVALNSAFDHDTGDITFLENPPPAPRYLAHFGLALMGSGLALALAIGTRFFLVSLAAGLAGFFYSVPPVRFKKRPGLDVMTNALVYGSLTPLAGWVATDRPLGPPMTNLLLAYLLLGWGSVPPGQIFQMEEDAARGDRTWALVLGKKGTLRLSMLAILAANGVLLVEVAKRYWGPRSIGLLAVLGFWCAVFVPWYKSYATVGSDYEQRRMYLVATGLAATDAAILLAMAG